MLGLNFVDLQPFCRLKLKRGEKPGGNRKKGVKKGGKKATVNDPIICQA
jgi:hypothetical protein